MIDWTRYPDFFPKEFRCPCCGEVRVAETLLAMLQAARNLAGTPFRITLGYRCPSERRVRGEAGDSSHSMGYAADIAAPDAATAFVACQALMRAGCKRIGLGKRFIHADVDPDRPSPALWIC
jgi:zinc D-Ala-D-Ala carboxypeptidase